MSIYMVIELLDRGSVQIVVQALEAYKERLRASITQTKCRLATFEVHFCSTTPWPQVRQS